jgi:dipeptidyl aminopeptidase/acylaminoacyl peptidase
MQASAGFRWAPASLIPNRNDADRQTKRSQPRRMGEYAEWPIRAAFDERGWHRRNAIDQSRDAGQPDWSGNGKLIVFTSFMNAQRDLLVMNADGTGITTVVSDGARNEFPEWSPKGHRIVFASDATGDFDI